MIPRSIGSAVIGIFAISCQGAIGIAGDPAALVVSLVEFHADEERVFSVDPVDLIVQLVGVFNCVDGVAAGTTKTAGVRCRPGPGVRDRTQASQSQLGKVVRTIAYVAERLPG